MDRWYLKTGPDSDVVISTRARLARNISKIPFSKTLSPEHFATILSSVKRSLARGTGIGKINEINSKTTTVSQRYSMIVNHVISSKMLGKHGETAVLLSGDYSLSVMIGDEDHIRIQKFTPGYDVDEAFNTAVLVERLISESVKYAFSDELGFLTKCPTNVGTGLRISVLCHLPAMEHEKFIPKLSRQLSALGLTIRGAYGEGSAGAGSMYQISNQITTGRSATEIIAGFKQIAAEIIAMEREKRAGLFDGNVKIQDKILRSYGLIKHAKLLSSEELDSYLSSIRLGVELGIIDDISYEKILEIKDKSTRRTLCDNSGDKMAQRAQIVKEIL